MTKKAWKPKRKSAAKRDISPHDEEVTLDTMARQFEVEYRRQLTSWDRSAWPGRRPVEGVEPIWIRAWAIVGSFKGIAHLLNTDPMNVGRWAKKDESKPTDLFTKAKIRGLFYALGLKPPSWA